MRVLIIGAGILGASTAWHLVRAGAEVVVIDAAHDGRATQAGAGIINPWSSGREDEAWYAMAAGGARTTPGIVAALAEEGETDTGYARVGAICVSADPMVLDEAEQRTRARAGNDPQAGAITRLTPAEARRLYIAGAARLDGRRLTASLLAAAGRRGMVLRRGQASLLAAAGRARGAVLDGETIGADCVVVAAGAWAPALLAPLGVALPVQPQRGQITHLRMEGVDTSAWPVVLPMTSHYMLAFEGGRVVVGATRETGSGFDYRVTAAGQAEVLNEALAVAPGLANATLLETRIGFRPAGPGLTPLLGPAPGMESLLIGNALGPTGLTIAPYAGQLLAKLALGEPIPLDLTPYKL
jgi:D-amino-acid dehydrogenase